MLASHLADDFCTHPRRPKLKKVPCALRLTWPIWVAAPPESAFSTLMLSSLSCLHGVAITIPKPLKTVGMPVFKWKHSSSEAWCERCEPWTGRPLERGRLPSIFTPEHQQWVRPGQLAKLLHNPHPMVTGGTVRRTGLLYR